MSTGSVGEERRRRRGKDETEEKRYKKGKRERETNPDIGKEIAENKKGEERDKKRRKTKEVNLLNSRSNQEK